MKTKNLKKTICIIIGLLLATAFSVTYTNYKQSQKIKEQEMINNYVECLKSNYTQRNYCSKKVSHTDYRILDQLMTKYGYQYKKVNNDLIVIKVK